MNTELLSVRTDPETIKRLGEIANKTDRSRNSVIDNALKDFVIDYQLREKEVPENRQDIPGRKEHTEICNSVLRRKFLK